MLDPALTPNPLVTVQYDGTVTGGIGVSVTSITFDFIFNF